LNAVPQKNLIAQVYIEEINQGLETAGYIPLTEVQKSNLTLILHEILEDTRTRKQEDSFIKAALTQTKGHFPAKDIKSVETMFYKAEQTAKAIGQHEFQGLEKQDLERVHGKSTLAAKSLLKIAEEIVREVLKEGFGVGLQTNGKKTTPTIGVAKQPYLIPVNTVEKTEAVATNPILAQKEVFSHSVMMEAPLVPSPVLCLSVKTSTSCEKQLKVDPSRTKIHKEKSVASERNESSKPIGNKLNIETTEKQKEKNKKDRVQWRNSNTGQFFQAPHKEITYSKNHFFNKPGLNIKREELSAGIIKKIPYIEPKQVNSHVQMGLTQSTSVSALQVSKENGALAVTVAADSRLEILKSDTVRVDLFAATLSASASDKELGFSAQVSAVTAQTTLKSSPNCHQGSCTEASLILDLHLGSAGIKAGFGQKELESGVKSTTVSAGIGAGLFGVSAQVDVKTWKNTEGALAQNGTELQDVLIQPKIK